MRKRRRALRPDGLAKLLDFHTDYYYNVVVMPGAKPLPGWRMRRLGKVMAALPNTKRFGNPSRRSFLWSLASFGLASKARKSAKQSETVYRFLTPECEVRMTVEYFENSQTKSLRFRERLSNRAFCLSASGEEDRSCLERFSGSLAIARYDFRSRLHSPRPFNLRERVLTIDHDSRLAPRPPFERVLVIERDVASDIQAFGYDRDDPQQAGPPARPFTLWCLLRQDLYLNEQSAAFLIVHWKHTFNFIRLVDVIPGDQTELIGE